MPPLVGPTWAILTMAMSPAGGAAAAGAAAGAAGLATGASSFLLQAIRAATDTTVSVSFKANFMGVFS
jgi:hypothetical protein